MVQVYVIGFKAMEAYIGRSTVYIKNRMIMGDFPKPFDQIEVGPKRKKAFRWVRIEIDAWIAQNPPKKGGAR